jgi:hypothetical protein
MAAASSGEADWRTSMRGLAGLCLPLRLTAGKRIRPGPYGSGSTATDSALRPFAAGM